ncbi:ribosome-recycling factor, mitochondrial [Agrilus planipennis]|uniref:Ribosome-recycling factor, mitochondrial n=1 Tax=Agrilus planipennis TaxID=224129 RepID=A0A1W4XSC9_AGRPL|nr:ribosome-recycling factor, mitochondrial [Agrilus planipennis]
MLKINRIVVIAARFTQQGIRLSCKTSQECTSPFSNPKLIIPKVNLLIVREYAKGKDKKKDKGKTQVKFNESEIAEFVNVDSVKNQMQKAIDDLKNDFVKQLSLRSSAGAIDSLKVTFDGKDYTLQELAQIIRKNPKTLVVNMHVFPQAIPAVLTALKNSGMNLNPQQDGTTLYIPIPKVTREHRETLAKNAKSLFVKYRDAIKDVKNKEIKSLKKKKTASEDQLKVVEQQVATLTDSYILEAEKVYNSKTGELLGEKE